MKDKLYCRIARLVEAYQNCIKSNNLEWQGKHEKELNRLNNSFMPSGSGIDCGTKFALEASEINKLVFYCSFHHMNEGGFYDGWTDHKIIVKPSLSRGFELNISGRDRNSIKEYLYEIFRFALDQEIE